MALSPPLGLLSKFIVVGLSLLAICLFFFVVRLEWCPGRIFIIARTVHIAGVWNGVTQKFSPGPLGHLDWVLHHISSPFA
jgi:hypothetical protein